MSKPSTTASRAKRPSKATARSITPALRAMPSNENPDFEIFLMGRRRDEMSAAMDCLSDGNPHWHALCVASIDATHRALLFPVKTDAGLAEKKRIVEAEGLEVSSDNWNGDFHEFIFGLDEERIAAA
jgi:hypothetical protein